MALSIVHRADLFREIVDESDVYVDVHKAIRRLTPAPRARRIHAEAAATIAASAAVNASKKNVDTTILVDVAENSEPEADAVSFKSNYEGGFHNAAKTAIHMKRRTSDGGMEGPPVLVKANLDEMRQNLRLGPANRAARPLNNSRASVFKIKQGLGPNQHLGDEASRMPPRAASHIGVTIHRRTASATTGSERTPLLVDDLEEEAGAAGTAGTAGAEDDKSRTNGANHSG